MIIRIPAVWWIAKTLSSPTGIGRATPCPTTQHAMRGVTRPRLVRALGVGTGAVLVIRSIIPIRTPLTYLPGHASYPTPTHISWIACCRSRSLHLRDMLRQPGGRRVLTIGAVSSSAQTGAPGGMGVKGETRDLISTAAPS